MSIIISIDELSLVFPQKICFDSFSTSIRFGERIALIGENGAGKSALLEMIANKRPTGDGHMRFHDESPLGYVAQMPAELDNLSGAERFQQSLSKALSVNPHLLILDEPSNHLDKKNRKQLMQFLKYYPGTLLIASHDVDILRTIPDTLWVFHQQRIDIFQGHYDDYLYETEHRRHRLNQQLESLKKDKKMMHQKKMQEQKRAKSSKEQGKKSIQNRKWPTIVSHAKMHRASMTAGRKEKQIKDKRESIQQALNDLDIPEVIVPKYQISTTHINDRSIIMVEDGWVGYEDKVIAKDIHLHLRGQERLAILGDNGCGKSTIVKAIVKDTAISQGGYWQVPPRQDIGYLDQFYQELNPEECVLATIEQVRPDWCEQQCRQHLNDFLFKKNEDINKLTKHLSGGEKARLSLAKIAARPPKLLILDEMTNNLDITSRQHVIQCLKHYPGAMILISHDDDFLASVGITKEYIIKKSATLSEA